MVKGIISHQWRIYYSISDIKEKDFGEKLNSLFQKRVHL